MRGYLSKETRLGISVTRLKGSIAKLHFQIKELTQKLKEKDKTIAQLQAKLQDKENQRKELLSYLYKPSKIDNPDTKPLGKKPGSIGYHRPKAKPEEITERHTYTLTRCPGCRGPVGPVVDQAIKYEEDIVLVPRKSVKEFTITRHWCPKCETYVKSPDVPPISRIGLKISEGEIAEKLKEAEIMFGKDYTAIKELIRHAKRVYADETGWRMGGNNWWLWAFVTERGIQYILEDTRGKGVAERALGDKTDRVIISDGYSAYKNLPGDKQQCWIHLLRSAKIHSPAIHQDLVILYHRLLIELEKPVNQRNKQYFKDKLDILANKEDEDSGILKIQARIIRDRDSLLTCLDYTGVLPENNTAERAIRPQVVMGKIFGGSRSIDGARAHAVNTSVIETMRKQNPNHNFFEIMLPLLEKRIKERHDGHSRL